METQIWVSIDLSNGFLHDGTKPEVPLLEPMLIFQ